MTPEERIEQAAAWAAEFADGVLIIATWVDDEGVTQSYETSRGNAHTVEGLRLGLFDGEFEDEDEDE
jgi:hypothetical protein